jgi:uncharacterized protein (TIGR03000 family)
MFSVVLFAALMAGENSADFHFRSCYGGAHSCYGGCYGSCYGWSSHAYYGGCYGKACHGGGYGSYSGCGGCMGMGGYGGCGGCWGAPYAGYGSVCHGGCAGFGGGCVGGCGGYLSPAYGVPGPVIGVPVGAAPAAGETRRDAVGMVDGAPVDRARIIFKLPQGAQLFVEGELIPNAEVQKAYRTPVLEAGKTYVYTMRIETEQEGQRLVGHATVNVRAGRTEEVDFTAVELKPELKVVSR